MPLPCRPYVNFRRRAGIGSSLESHPTSPITDVTNSYNEDQDLVHLCKKSCVYEVCWI